MNTHKDLRVWQASLALSVETYSITRSFPGSERFGLSQQMRRASVSIASNIAEGAARGSTRDFVRFLRIARGSLAELETQAELAELTQIATSESLVSLRSQAATIGRQLNALIRTLATSAQSLPVLPHSPGGTPPD